LLLTQFWSAGTLSDASMLVIAGVTKAVEPITSRDFTTLVNYCAAVVANAQHGESRTAGIVHAALVSNSKLTSFSNCCVCI